MGFMEKIFGDLNAKEVKKIEKIVYSLWTKPSGNILENAVNWYSPKSQLLCLALTVLKSKEFFN